MSKPCPDEGLLNLHLAVLNMGHNELDNLLTKCEDVIVSLVKYHYGGDSVRWAGIPYKLCEGAQEVHGIRKGWNIPNPLIEFCFRQLKKEERLC